MENCDASKVCGKFFVNNNKKKNQKFRFYIFYKIFKSSFSFEVAIPWDQNGMEEATNANVNFLR